MGLRKERDGRKSFRAVRIESGEHLCHSDYIWLIPSDGPPEDCFLLAEVLGSFGFNHAYRSGKSEHVFPTMDLRLLIACKIRQLKSLDIYPKKVYFYPNFQTIKSSA
jgi:hypothetical protein